MAYRLGEVLEKEATLLRDAEFDRTGFVTVAEGRALAFAANAKYLRLALKSAGVSALIVPPDLADEVPESFGLATADDPEIAFYRLHNRLAQQKGMGVRLEHSVDSSAQIHPAAHVEQGCRIGPGVVVEAGAIIHAGTILEEGVRVCAGAQIGCEGYFCKRRPGLLLQAAHAGGVHVGRDSIIMAGAMVQRSVHCDFTRLGARVAVGPLVNISHGARVGDDTSIAGGAEISGYVIIGARVWVGPGAVLSNLIEIGDDARIEIGSVVVRSVPSSGRQSGFFAGPHESMRRMRASLTKYHG